MWNEIFLFFSEFFSEFQLGRIIWEEIKTTFSGRIDSCGFSPSLHLVSAPFSKMQFLINFLSIHLRDVKTILIFTQNSLWLWLVLLIFVVHDKDLFQDFGFNLTMMKMKRIMSEQKWRRQVRRNKITHFFIGNSIFHLSLELLTKFWKMKKLLSSCT